jgi:hypothetical protein
MTPPLGMLEFSNKYHSVRDMCDKYVVLSAETNI